MKKLLLLISLLTPLCAHADWVGNWLVGASLGYANQTGSFHTQLTYATFNENPTNPFLFIARDHSDNGFLGGLFLGYQAICRKWLAGIEFNTEWRDIDQGHPFAFSGELPFIDWEGTERYERKRIGALTGRIGYAITTYFMPYARLGVELGQDHFQTTFNGFHSAEKHWTHRCLVGAGFEIPLPRTCGATFRLEYNYASKGRTIELSETIPIPPLEERTVSFATFDSSMQPITQSWKGSLVWNFF